MANAIQLEPADNVVIAPRDISQGASIEVAETGQILTAAEPIKAGHKIARRDLKAGELVYKYGIPIGRMTADCPAGGWVHSHNVADITAELCSSYCSEYVSSGRQIQAFPRPGGGFGIANYSMIFSTSVRANLLAEALYQQTSAIWFVCDKRHLEAGSISSFTQLAITKTAQNPNVYAALIIGSEEETPRNLAITEEIRAAGKQAVYLPVSSQAPLQGEQTGLDLLNTWEREAAALKRQPVPLDGLTMAIHCGGSDWTTAISGNPTLGVAADLIVQQGGYILMDEWAGFPGSEHLLAQQAVTRQIGLQVIDKVNETRARYLLETGEPIEASNPKPFNKEGGITTLVEKSTGNIKKAGSSGLQGILKPGERPTIPGVYIQDQLCSGALSTAVYAALSGCHINVFVTGDGFIYQELPYMPTIRMTGNPETYKDPQYLLDFNAGTVLEGKPMAEAGQELFEYILAVCEGREHPKNQAQQCRAFIMYYYEDEFTAPRYNRIWDYKQHLLERVDAVKQ